MKNKSQIFEEGMWVTLKSWDFEWPVRYISKLNKDNKTFIDDGKYSNESPSNYCHLKYYKPI